MRISSSPTKRILSGGVLVIALCLVGGLDAGRRGKPPLAALNDTAWIFSGEYRVRSKPLGGLESYVLDFIVDFFDDGTFTAQCLPIEEGMEDDFFSGTWVQNRNKMTLIFDMISKVLLADIFVADFAADPAFDSPVDVVVEKWEIKAKLKVDATDVVFVRFKERLRHVAVFEGIPLRFKTKGRGDGGFFESIALE